MLSYDNSNYYAFEIQNTGKARMNIHEGSDFSFIGEAIETAQKSSPDKPVKFKIKVSPEEIEFYVNNVFVEKKKRNNETFSIREIGLRVCGEQTAYFDKIVVTEILD